MIDLIQYIGVYTYLWPVERGEIGTQHRLQTM